MPILLLLLVGAALAAAASPKRPAAVSPTTGEPLPQPQPGQAPPVQVSGQGPGLTPLEAQALGGVPTSDALRVAAGLQAGMTAYWQTPAGQLEILIRQRDKVNAGQQLSAIDVAQGLQAGPIVKGELDRIRGKLAYGEKLTPAEQRFRERALIFWPEAAAPAPTPATPATPSIPGVTVTPDIEKMKQLLGF